MKHLKTLVLVAALVAVGGGLWLWWQHERIHPSTDDAYLGANVLTIAPQVGGAVETVSVVENQHVAAGDLLFQLDTKDLEASVEAAQAARQRHAPEGEVFALRHTVSKSDLQS